MMCYKDMTFCTFYEDCAKAKDCHRPLTPEVRAAAEKWWGGDDYPIARFMNKPGCHSPVGRACPHGCIFYGDKLHGDCRIPWSDNCALNSNTMEGE